MAFEMSWAAEAVSVRRCLLPVVLSSALAGCAVGPDFIAPDAPAVARYTEREEADTTVEAPGGAQRFVRGGEVAAEWWALFASDKLTYLIQSALANNQELKAAQANLRQSQEQLAAARGVLFPKVDGSLGVSKRKFTATRFGGAFESRIFTLYTADITVEYTLDLFGAARRGLENRQALVDNQRYQLQAAYLTLIGNAINTALSEASLRARIEITEKIIALQERQLATVRAQAEAGIVSRADVLSVQSALAATKAELPPLAQGVSEARHLLATLTGKTPAQHGGPAIDLSEISLPQQLPVSLPSDLVRQRPDILAAEAQMHAASANIGVATAAMYPQLDLNGDFGQESISGTELFSSINSLWSYGAELTAPIFQGGKLRAERRAAIAAFEVALAEYRQIVLAAFAQVADVLRALQHDAESLQAQAEAVAVAEEALALVEKNYQAGIEDFLAVLNADRQYQQARIGYVDALTKRYQDTAALFAAVGGGWWHQPASE